MNKEELKIRTKEFAHRCVKLSMALPKNYLGNHIKDQLIRCSTSVASDERLLNKQKVTPLLKEAKELAAIFVSSRKTARKNSQ